MCAIAVTPNIDKLVKKGVSFKRAYAQYANCSPSRMSFLTGLSPERLGHKGNYNDKSQFQSHASLPGYLKKHGYKTYSFGKVYHDIRDDSLSWDYIYDIERINGDLQWESYALPKNQILENAVHGHQNAKRQIERIIGQWMNGEQSGYCFGFEGPPGVGKTSLAKEGLAYCLEDNDKSTRPFSFIAIGGSSNGSTLDGHNYTYVGSTWGRIVDALMESKCMNPIIYIDELDKISKTEHGKEIVGIVEVIKEHYIDKTDKSGRFVAVTVKFKKKLDRTVTLEDIKKRKELGDLALIKQSRLSAVSYTHLTLPTNREV